MPNSPKPAAAGAATAASAPNLRQRHGGRRELIVFLILLACGFFVMPLLIWVVGHAVLGPYSNGGPFALLADFFAGLRSGTLTYWCVVFGPYVFVLILRGLWHLFRHTAHAAD